MLLNWWKSERRRKILAPTYPEGWLNVLTDNVRHFPCLPDDLRQRLLDKTRIFVAERTWVTCDGLVIDDEVRVTIAAQACLMLLGYDDDFCYDRVRSVLIYPGVYLQRRSSFGEPTPRVAGKPVLGEAWPKGPIVLSWAHALAGGLDTDRGRNVVLHEFARHLDDLDGTPPLGSRQDRQRWTCVIRAEYQQLVAAARRGCPTLLDRYGAENPGEFFAVATECFFMRPRSLRHRHDELYAVLSDFYRLDPAAWYEERNATDDPQPALSPVELTTYRQSVARTLCALRLPPQSADEAFAEGVIHTQNDQLPLALECFAECLRRDPDDAEAYFQRGATLFESGNPAAALTDLNEAIRRSPEEAEYYQARCRTHRALGNAELAQADWQQARHWDPRLLDEDD